MMNEVEGGQVCSYCATPNPPIAAYCSQCGALLNTIGRASMPRTRPYPRPVVPAAAPAPYGNAVAAGYPQPGPPTTSQQGAFAARGNGTASNAQAQPYQQQSYTAAYAGQRPRQGYGETPAVSVQVNPVINVHVPLPQAAPPAAVVVHTPPIGPNLVVRALWFLCVGLWLGALATIVGWALCVGVVTLPLGLLILNRLPSIMTLRPATTTMQVTTAYGVTMINHLPAPQYPLAARAAYFLLIGWWFSALWLLMAWCLVGLSVVTLGLSLAPAFMMFNRVPQVLTLRRN